MRIQPSTVRLYHALWVRRCGVNGLLEATSGIERIAGSYFGERIERIIWIGGTTVTL